MFCVDSTLMKARVSSDSPEPKIAGKEVVISRHSLLPPFDERDTVVYVHFGGWSYKIPFSQVEPILEQPMVFAKAS